MCNEQVNCHRCVTLVKIQNPESGLPVMTRHTPSDSPCGDPTYSQHRLSPAESRIQNQEIDFPPEARLGYVMTRHTPSTCKIQNSGACLCLVRILSRIQGEGAEFKIKNQPGPLEGMVNDGHNPESRIMRGGSWLRKESKIQSSESGSRV